MNFQIERLIVWPNKDGFEPREIEFKLNCLNVLSGDSRTGKSALVAIIDYCLGAHDCSVPGGKVRENASWFGIVVKTDNGRLLLARRNPDAERKETCDFFVRDLEDGEKIPGKIESKNSDTDSVVDRLSRLAGLESIRRDDYGYENARISFRDVCHLLLQPQDVVASRLQMFDKMNVYHSKEKLANWFNYVIGVETTQDILDKIELEKIRRALDGIARERERDIVKLGEWINRLRGELMSARNYGLIDDACEIPSAEDRKALLALAKETVAATRRVDKPPKSEYAIKREIRRLEEEYSKAAAAQSRAEKRVGVLIELTETIQKTGVANVEKHDRLQISKWISKNWQPSKICPVCGGVTHPAARDEVEKICHVVEELENVRPSIEEFPLATIEELKLRQKEADDAKRKAADIYEQINAVKRERREIGNYIEDEKKKAAILEGIKRTLELESATLGESRLNKEEQELNARLKEIKGRYNAAVVKKRADEAYSRICMLTHERFCAMDSEDIYQVYPPLFNNKDLTIVLVDKNNQRYSLHEVGSASNWVASHVAFTAALQEFSAGRECSCIPRFVVYDQPSQVYFPAPKLAGKTMDNEPTQDIKLSADDIENVRKIFMTLSSSCNGVWQAIVLDHAGADVYGDVPGVNILKPWRGREALIPREWYAEEGAQS